MGRGRLCCQRQYLDVAQTRGRTTWQLCAPPLHMHEFARFTPRFAFVCFRLFFEKRKCLLHTFPLPFVPALRTCPFAAWRAGASRASCRAIPSTWTEPRETAATSGAVAVILPPSAKTGATFGIREFCCTTCCITWCCSV